MIIYQRQVRFIRCRASQRPFSRQVRHMLASSLLVSEAARCADWLSAAKAEDLNPKRCSQIPTGTAEQSQMREPTP